MKKLRKLLVLVAFCCLVSSCASLKGKKDCDCPTFFDIIEKEWTDFND